MHDSTKLPYFPFGQRFNDKMGTMSLSESSRLVEVDKHYLPEVSLKRQLLTELPTYYFQALPNYELAQWDVVELILTSLSRFSPDLFTLRCNDNHWHWTNNVLNEEIHFTFGDTATLPYAPLDWVGRQIQEDLILLAGSDATLVAGQLCFANDWCLDEKIGQPFWQIHAPVTSIVEPMMISAQKLMERLPVGRPAWRMNWSVKISDQLDMTSRHMSTLKQQLKRLLPALTPETIGDKLYIRIERQTVSRLLRSKAILFSVHTYQNLLSDEANNPERAYRMAQVFSTTPKAMLDYKSMTGFMHPLLTYLEKKASVPIISDT